MYIYGLFLPTYLDEWIKVCKQLLYMLAYDDAAWEASHDLSILTVVFRTMVESFRAAYKP